MKVLKAVSQLSLSDVVLGQYEGDPEGADEESRKGYLQVLYGMELYDMVWYGKGSVRVQ